MLLALWPLYQMRLVVKDAGFQSAEFDSPVLHAEFQVSSEEVLDLYGAENTPDRATRTGKMRRAHDCDNLFLLLYGAFLAVFAFQGYRLTRQWHFLALLFLAVLAAIADFIENASIVEITHALDKGERNFSLMLRRLQIFTWLKWLSLAFYSGVSARFFWRIEQWGNFPKLPGKLFAVVCIAVSLVTLTAFGTLSAQWENLMSQAFPVFFTGLFLFCLLFKPRHDGTK